MNKQTTEEGVYKSNNKIFLFGIGFAFMLFFLKIITHTHYPFLREWINYMVVFFIAAIAFYYAKNIFLVLSNEEIIISNMTSFIIKKASIPSSTIDMVRRIRPSFVFGYGDNFMTFYFKDGSHIRIHESYYDISTIKDFLTDLKTRRPWIEFDKQYLDLLEGKVPCDNSFLQVTPRYTEFYSDELFDRYFS